MGRLCLLNVRAVTVAAATLVSNTPVWIVFTVTIMTIWRHRQTWHFFITTAVYYAECVPYTSDTAGIHNCQATVISKFFVYRLWKFTTWLKRCWKNDGWICEEFYSTVLILCPTKSCATFGTPLIYVEFCTMPCNAFYTPIIHVDKIYCLKTSPSFHGWHEPIFIIRYWY